MLVHSNAIQMWAKYVQRKWLLPCVSFIRGSSDGLGRVEYTCEPSKTVRITSRLPLITLNFPVFSSEQQQEMHKICSLAYERLQRLLRKCQGHLCCSKRVWNEDGECVTLRWEVITGSSKAAHYVSFTGHSLVVHYIFFTPQDLVMSPEVSGVQMCIKICDAREQQLNGCRWRWLDATRWRQDVTSCARSHCNNHSPPPGTLSLYVFMCGRMTEYTFQVLCLASLTAAFSPDCEGVVTVSRSSTSCHPGWSALNHTETIHSLNSVCCWAWPLTSLLR